MKNLLLLIIIIVLTIATPSPLKQSSVNAIVDSPSAPIPAFQLTGDVIYENDFEDTDLSDWQFEDGMAFVDDDDGNGVLQIQHTDWASIYYELGDRWDNYVFEGRFNIVRGNVEDLPELYLNYRADINQPRGWQADKYTIGLSTTRTATWMGGFDHDEWFGFYTGDGLIPLSKFNWYTFQILVFENRVNYFFDGVQVGEIEDDTYHRGSIGFTISPGVRVLIDNISVRTLNSLPEMSSPEMVNHAGILFNNPEYAAEFEPEATVFMEPSTSSNSVGTVQELLPLELIADGDNVVSYEVDGMSWYQILVAEDTAWIPVEAVSFTRTIRQGVAASNGRLRAEPSTQSNVVGGVSQGQRLPVLNEAEGESITIDGETSNLWYQIDLNGDAVYISSLLFREEEVSYFALPASLPIHIETVYRNLQYNVNTVLSLPVNMDNLIVVNDEVVDYGIVTTEFSGLTELKQDLETDVIQLSGIFVDVYRMSSLRDPIYVEIAFPADDGDWYVARMDLGISGYYYAEPTDNSGLLTARIRDGQTTLFDIRTRIYLEGEYGDLWGLHVHDGHWIQPGDHIIALVSPQQEEFGWVDDRTAQEALSEGGKDIWLRGRAFIYADPTAVGGR